MRALATGLLVAAVAAAGCAGGGGGGQADIGIACALFDPTTDATIADVELDRPAQAPAPEAFTATASDADGETVDRARVPGGSPGPCVSFALPDGGTYRFEATADGADCTWTASNETTVPATERVRVTLAPRATDC